MIGTNFEHENGMRHAIIEKYDLCGLVSMPLIVGYECSHYSVDTIRVYGPLKLI